MTDQVLVPREPSEIRDTQDNIEWLRWQASLFLPGADKFAYRLQDVAEELDRLRKRFHELEQSVLDLSHPNVKMLFESLEAEATENAALRADAERYRWLRVNWHEDDEGWWDHGMSPDDLDAVIDATLDQERRGK